MWNRCWERRRMHRNSSTVSTKQKVAHGKQSPQMGFTSLAHLMDIDWLQEAYRRTRKDGAAGVDGMTAEQYEANLKSNLEGLIDRVKAGTYRAPPVRRVHIPKGNSPSEKRPIGGYRRWRTRFCSGPWPWCWSRSMSRTFMTVRSAFGPGARRTRRWRCYGNRR